MICALSIFNSVQSATPLQLHELYHDLLLLSFFNEHLAVREDIRCDHRLLVRDLFTIDLQTALLYRHESFSVARNKSKFLDEDAEVNDKPIILQFAGNVKAGTVAEYGDTGVGQKAAIKKGVASLQEVEVPSPCRLMPYRTFTEVKQPMSSFIFRVKDNDRLGVSCALFEADGGAWKNEAKKNIKDYLEKELAGVPDIFVIS